jgi:hypothetical protein
MLTDPIEEEEEEEEEEEKKSSSRRRRRSRQMTLSGLRYFATQQQNYKYGSTVTLYMGPLTL